MDNGTFWNDRYRTLAELGSGPGSRGWVPGYKRMLVNAAIDRCAAATVADVGCGDACWLDEEMTSRVAYRGYDIADVIVQRNASAFPAAQFAVHDIVGGPVERADLVICFDVLIHQNDRPSFDTALRHLASSAGRMALVSYATPPSEAGDPAEPAGPPVGASAEWIAAEAEFQSLHKALPADFPRAIATCLGPLPDLVASLLPGIHVQEIGRHRAQTVYELTGF
jgi:hypothetical protein